MKKVLVLGCTGSIGSQTLDIVRTLKDEFSVCGLAAGSSEAKVASLCKEFSCKGTVFSKDGLEGLEHLIKNCGADIAVNGIAGSAGLKPSVLALEAGINLALANKESVVMAWPIIKSLAKAHDAHIIPVDSEHSAIFSLLSAHKKENVSELVITASGGPFRDYTAEELEKVTVQDALRHPTWSMGPKITIDSASLANKGLEVIEACRLFDMPPEKVAVAVHPQSLVHSLVRTNDGVLYAQISEPDMRHPILNALRWPKNEKSYLKPFSLFGKTLTFSEPRTDAFPMLGLAYEAAKKGGSRTIAFNAANEVAVAAFMEGKLSFTGIPRLVKSVMSLSPWDEEALSLEAVFKKDREAREEASRLLKSGGVA